MSNQQHMIGRTVLALDSGAIADVWELQETVSRLLQNQAMAELDPLFSELAGEDEVIRLDQVEVDLGVIAPHAIETDFVPALVSALREALGDRIAELRLPPQLRPQQDPLLTHRQTSAASHWGVFLYFLQYGRLPWWQKETHWQRWVERWQAVIISENDWQSPLLKRLAEASTVQRRLVSQFSDEFCHQLIHHLHPVGPECCKLLSQARQLTQAMNLTASVQSILNRAALHLAFDAIPYQQPATGTFPTSLWICRWLEHLHQQSLKASPFFPRTGRARRWISNLWQRNNQPSEQSQSAAASSASASQRKSNRIVYSRLSRALKSIPAAERGQWQDVIEQIFSPSAPPITDTAEGSDRSIWPSIRPQSNERSADSESVSTQQNTRTPTQRDSSEDAEIKQFVGEETNEPTDEAIALPENIPDTQSESPTEFALPDSLNDDARPSNNRSGLSLEEEISGLYINQAGLVLLHPFLVNFFRGVGLVIEDSFCDDLAQQTGIYLLNYLATGQTSAPEYELVLPKLLCGWPLNEPIAPDILLTEEARSEAENLLQTAINYWEVLKNTSPDGLREGFLQREGKLTHTDSQQWKLQVEQMAIDVLLSRLPWGLSMVKLPWMDELLIVEWT